LFFSNCFYHFILDIFIIIFFFYLHFFKYLFNFFLYTFLWKKYYFFSLFTIEIFIILHFAYLCYFFLLLSSFFYNCFYNFFLCSTLHFFLKNYYTKKKSFFNVEIAILFYFFTTLKMSLRSYKSLLIHVIFIIFYILYVSINLFYLLSKNKLIIPIH